MRVILFIDNQDLERRQGQHEILQGLGDRKEVQCGCHKLHIFCVNENTEICCDIQSGKISFNFSGGSATLPDAGTPTLILLSHVAATGKPISGFCFNGNSISGIPTFQVGPMLFLGKWKQLQDKLYVAKIRSQGITEILSAFHSCQTNELNQLESNLPRGVKCESS